MATLPFGNVPSPPQTGMLFKLDGNGNVLRQVPVDGSSSEPPGVSVACL